MKTRTTLLTLILGLVFFTTKAQVNEQTKSKMFCAALSNFSTAPNYVVVTVKNKKTGVTKELCTTAPFIQGAMYHETGNMMGNCKYYKSRYFEFSNDSALWNISFDLYTKDDLDTYAKTLNIPEIVQQVKSGRLTSKTFTGSGKEQIMFAHLMFNHGVMMRQGCLAGNICGLTYFIQK